MRSALLLVLLLIAGCTQPGAEEDSQAPADPSVPAEDSNALPSGAASADPERQPVLWNGTGCIEMQAEFPFLASTYEGQLPEGFRLAKTDGMAIVTTVSRVCDAGDAAGGTHLVFLAVEPPAGQAREDAEHGLLVAPVWLDGVAAGPWADAGIPVHARSFSLHGTDGPVLLAARMESDPGWYIAIQAHDPEPRRHASLRLWGAAWDAQAERSVVTGRFDLDVTGAVEATAGSASAHHILLVGGGNVPFHQVGTGRLTSPAQDVTYTFPV